MENPGITATLKAGKDFDSPWLVLHATSTDQLNNQLDSLTQELLQKVTTTAQLLIATNNAAAGGLLAPAAPPVQTQAVPVSAPVADYQLAQAQAAAGPSCTHGARVRRQGTSNRGAWVGWFCPTPKGTPGQCSPDFE